MAPTKLNTIAIKLGEIMQKLSDLPISFEFFPPKTDKGAENLNLTLVDLVKYEPDFFSVTFGAGGSTRDTTYDAVANIQQNTSVSAAPHISCIRSTRTEILNLLEKYQQLGINYLVALRGDIPQTASNQGEFKYASELISFIRQQTGDHFTIAVAAYPEIHPEASNAEHDFNHFCNKMNSGADLAITQYFYNVDAFYRFQDLYQQRGFTQALIPGIMPINNLAKLQRFSTGCGAEIPRWILQTMANYADDAQSQLEFGLDVVTKLCDDLICNGVDGLHFYTMNQTTLVANVLDRLGLPRDYRKISKPSIDSGLNHRINPYCGKADFGQSSLVADIPAA